MKQFLLNDRRLRPEGPLKHDGGEGAGGERRPRTRIRGHVLRAWADSYVTREDVCASECSLASLAAEIMRSKLDVHNEVTAGSDAGGTCSWRAWSRCASAGNCAVTTPGRRARPVCGVGISRGRG
jgi:hypothetical protein